MDSGKFLLILFAGLILYGLFQLSVHLWNSFVDWLADTAWPRIKDWFRNLGDSIRHREPLSDSAKVAIIFAALMVTAVALLWGISAMESSVEESFPAANTTVPSVSFIKANPHTTAYVESPQPTSFQYYFSTRSAAPTRVPTVKPTRTPTPTPTRVVYTPTPSAEDEEIIVYVTEYGSKYHRRSCGSLWNSCYEITLSKAIANGYTPCKKCNPPK